MVCFLRNVMMAYLFVWKITLKYTPLKHLILFISVISTSLLTAQQRVPVKGKLKSDAEDLEGIYIINKTADLSTETERGGYFTLMAKAGDTLVISGIQISAKNMELAEEDINSELLFIPVEKFTRVLDELIIIDYRHINAESLGLVPRGQKQLTPTEKRLYTAKSGVDAVFNMFSGRTKMLKRANETAKKEKLMEKIDYIYTEEELIEKYHIPREYLRGFVYYIVEDENFARAIKDKNETMAKFLISGLSVRYLDLIKDEK